jgi:hypothetical protein
MVTASTYRNSLGKSQFFYSSGEKLNTPPRLLADFPNAKSTYQAKRNEINNTL